MITVIRQPDLPKAELGKLQSGETEAHACSDINRLSSERLTINQVVVVDISW